MYRPLPVFCLRQPNRGNSGDYYILLGLQSLLQRASPNREIDWLLLNKLDPQDVDELHELVMRAGYVVFSGGPQYTIMGWWPHWWHCESWTEAVVSYGLRAYSIAGGVGCPLSSVTPQQFAWLCAQDPKTMEVMDIRRRFCREFVVRDPHSSALLKHLAIEHRLLPCCGVFAARRYAIHGPSSPSVQDGLTAITVPGLGNVLPADVGVGGCEMVGPPTAAALVKVYRALEADGKMPVIVCHELEESKLFEGYDVRVFASNDHAATLRFYARCSHVVSGRLHGALPAWGMTGKRVVHIGVCARASALELFPAIPNIHLRQVLQDPCCIIEALGQAQPAAYSDVEQMADGYDETVGALLAAYYGGD